MKLKEKVAVITGGASGMGLATVNRYLEEGARVVIADFNADTGEKALAAARADGFGDSVTFIRTDVAREADIVAMLDEAVDQFGGLDIVFNNAGVGGAIGPLTETSVEVWDYTFDVLARESSESISWVAVLRDSVFVLKSDSKLASAGSEGITEVG